MALFGGRFTAAGREHRAVLRALNDLSERHTPVQLEMEHNSAGFFTLVSLHKELLVVGRPRSVPGGLARGAYVRLTLPNTGRRQVRLPVLVPLMKLPVSNRYACICALPDAWSGQCRRNTDRFRTTRYRNLRLELPEAERNFRVVDISSSGLRILTGDEDAGLMLFEPGMELAPAHLLVGQRVQIQLERLVVRSRGTNTAGLEMQTAHDGASERFLVNLLNKLQEAEIKRLSIDAVG